MPRLAEKFNRNEHLLIIEKLFFHLIAIMFFPFLILSLFGIRLVPFVFGNEWLLAGGIASILSLRYFIEIIISPFFSMIDIIEKQEFHLIRNIGAGFTTLVSLITGIYYNYFFLVMIVYVTLEVLLLTVISKFIMNELNFPFFKNLYKVKIYFILPVFLTTILYYTLILLKYNNIILLFILGLMGLLYYSFYYFKNKNILSTYFPNFSNKFYK